MKAFIAPLALLGLAAGVAGQDPNCQANYILDTCLDTENAQISTCGSTDYACLCPAYQALLTCYNNCPKDNRIPTVQSEVTIYCQAASQAALTMTTTKPVSAGTGIATASPTGDVTATAAGSSPTDGGSGSGSTSGGSSGGGKKDNTGAAAELAFNTGAVLFGVAAVVAAVL